VSSSLLSKIAHKHKVEFHETLTGFKWLAKIPNLRFGYEEALGYAIDPLAVNDKDGISVALLIAQIVDELKRDGESIEDYLETIWNEYGYHLTSQISIRVNDLGAVGKLLDSIRQSPPQQLGQRKLIEFNDLAIATEKLPATNGIRMYFSDGLRVIIRPSGTEPKMKCYLELVSHYEAHNRYLADQDMAQIREQISGLLSLN
jgi:phosphomannomutase